MVTSVPISGLRSRRASLSDAGMLTILSINTICMRWAGAIHACVMKSLGYNPRHFPEARMPNGLTWQDTNKLGILLSNTHPEIEPHSVELADVHRYVVALSEFNGDPNYFDEQTLTAIRDAWNTEFLERTRSWA